MSLWLYGIDVGTIYSMSYHFWWGAAGRSPIGTGFRENERNGIGVCMCKHFWDLFP